MIGYAAATALFLLAQGYFTHSILVDPTLSRGRRLLRLALIWLLPVFGLALLASLYTRDLGPGTRSDPGQRNEHGPYR